MARLSKPSTSNYRRGFKAWAEKKAVEYRITLSLRPTDPLPAVKLAEHLNVQIFIPAQIPGLSKEHLTHLERGEDWSALTYKIDSNCFIIHNNSHHSVRQESNIMHELAHIICEHKMGQLEHQALGIPLREYDANQEAEAEWLGGCLQLPRVALYYKKAKNGLSIAEIAQLFNASEPMVKYRLGVTGLLKK